MKMRTSLIGASLAIFLIAICFSGTALAADPVGEVMELSFQEHHNNITGELDESYTGCMDISLRKWAPTSGASPNTPKALTGQRGRLNLRQRYYFNIDIGQYPAALIYFPDIISTLEALPDEPLGEPGHGINEGIGPYIVSAKLILYCSAYSANPNREEGVPNELWVEVSMVTPHATMWTDQDTPYNVGDQARPRTNAVYRWYDDTAPVAWANSPIDEHRDGNPANNAQGTAGDHGDMVDAVMLDGNPWVLVEVAELDVTPIVSDWAEGVYDNQGFHIDMGVHYWDNDYELILVILSQEGADGTWIRPFNEPFEGTLPEHSPKLVIEYAYDALITADAGPDMGEAGATPDADKRVKPGETILLNGSGSAPIFAYSPLTQYKWSWNYGGAEYTITSPNDQSNAQFFEMVVGTDNVSLTASDALGQSGTDGAKINVTARIPGDIDGSGKVDFADFNI
ncbi:MAG: hypothetical protein JXA52_00785, partial [Planctomycetes bacterium]|nr:hypothetical protein [Planctomycetota bacterium]